jgi:peroxiredoxin
MVFAGAPAYTRWQPLAEVALDLPLVIALVATWLVVAFVCFLVYQLMVQNGRILMRLDALQPLQEVWADESELSVEEYLGSLPAGVPAPAFALPDLNGVPRALSEWRGKRVLLIFFDPDSAFCRSLLPWLAALASDVIPDRPVPLVVSTGPAEKNRELFDEAGYTGPVLLQRAMEVAGTYKVDGTPMSYLIEPDGLIGSEVATGIQATLILAGDMAAADATGSELAPAAGRDAGAGGATPRWHGLPEGATAPVFRLPRLDGGELSLLEYRGARVVLVFSDPECEPCDALAPLLQNAHRLAPELPIVMIGRGDPAANRAKATEYGLTFPIVLQRHWEVSQEYGLLAAPVAYLIDEWGALAEAAAIGRDQIVDLLVRATGHDDIRMLTAYNATQ